MPFCGEYDGIRNGTYAYYHKLNKLNIPVQLIIGKGQIHAALLLYSVCPDGDDPIIAVAKTILTWVS